MYLSKLRHRCPSGLVRWALVIWLLLLCQISSAWAYVEIPKLSARVTDLTGTLNAGQASALENKLAAFEAKKGSQIAVLIVPTTEPEDIAEFGIKVADLWRVGRKGVDDGLILIVAKDDRKLRLEIGYGLEGVIPDAIAKRITSETIKPFFKNGDIAGGIDAGVNQVMGLIEGEQLPAPTPQNGYPQQDTEGGFIFILFGGLFVGSLLASMFGRATGGLMAGLGSAGVATLLMGFGLGAILVGIIVFFLISARGGGGGWSNGGGYYPGGGGYYRGGGGGNTTWSGGGGGFGGGGASDSW